MEIHLIPSDIEDYTRKEVFKSLSRGDPKWDVPHTTGVVYHLKRIIHNSPEIGEVDSEVMILAAYGHDWGYSEFYQSGRSLTKEEYLEAKKSHAQIAVSKMRKLLVNRIYDDLSQDRKDRILHLILVHDELDILKDKDELILMEADTLGGLDTDFVTPTWTREQSLKHLEVVRNKRLPKFITDYGKREFEVCSTKRLNS